MDDGVAPAGVRVRGPVLRRRHTRSAGERPRCPVMAHFGERDQGIPVAGVREFAAASSRGTGLHLRRRSRLQLRSARRLRRGGGEARARAYARIPASPRRLSVARSQQADKRLSPCRSSAVPRRSSRESTAGWPRLSAAPVCSCCPYRCSCSCSGRCGSGFRRIRARRTTWRRSSSRFMWPSR